MIEHAQRRSTQRGSDRGERRKAMLLCRGAASDAPARCYGVVDDLVGFSDLDAVRLCQRATSVEPATCAARLDGLGFEELETVRYCAAHAWPIGPIPGSGSPACVARGRDRTSLSQRDLVRLCRGSTDAAPVTCYERGRDETALSDREVVALCQPVMIYAPTRVSPQPRS